MKKTLILTVALIWGNCHLQAHEFGLDYTTEWQSDFKKGMNWANMLQLSASLQLSHSLSIEASTISFAKTRQEPILDDLQGFSNIDADNLPFTFSVLGAELNLGKSTLFFGIRNVNEDYFTSPVTSFFTNSSCGIYPTIASNYDIANYPNASWCLHQSLQAGAFTVNTSLYPGRGYHRLAGHENIFRLAPGRDGLFFITSSEYGNNDSNYHLGCGLYYGKPVTYEMGDEAATPSQEKKKVSVAPWFNVEQHLAPGWHLMLQGSLSTLRYGCKYYAGVGATYGCERIRVGIFTDMASFTDQTEYATELTCHVKINDNICLQPAFHIIHDGHKVSLAGIARVSLSL